MINSQILMWTLRRVGRNRKMFPSSYAYYKAKTRCYEVLLAFDSIYEVKVCKQSQMLRLPSCESGGLLHLLLYEILNTS